MKDESRWELGTIGPCSFLNWTEPVTYGFNVYSAFVSNQLSILPIIWIPDNSGVEQSAKPLLSKGRLPSEGPPFPDG